MPHSIDLTPVRRPDRMASYWRRAWPVVALAAASGVLFNGGMSLVPVLQGRLLDTVVYDAGWNGVLRRAAEFLAVVLALQALRAVKRYSVRVFANQTGAVMRRMLYHDLLHRSLRELAEEEAGDLMSKAVGDVDLCVEGMRKVTTEVFDTGVLMLGYLVTLALYDWRIALPACASIPLAMWLAERLKAVIVHCNRAARAQSSAVAQRTYDDVEHMLLYRVNGLLPLRQESYEAELRDLEEKAVRAGVLENSMQPVYGVLSMLGVAAVLVLGGQKVVAGLWTVGDFTAFLTLYTALATKASRAARLFNAFQKAVVSWKRVKPYCTEYKEEDRSQVADAGQGLACRDLSFRYAGAEQDLLRHVSFSARPGEFVGVTGPVASGKSTLGLALTGAYPYGGSIRVNGLELRELTAAQRSRRVSYLGHAPQLLSDTLYRNVTLGGDGDIRGVLADVCFEEDLASMPQGLDTVVGNSGVRLSGGQQDRVALARALWHRAPLMILDDPFSAVDTATEAAILDNLRRHYPDCAFVLLSHRLSAFPALDRVVYLEDGGAVCGTHAQLLEHCGGYRALYALQTGEGAACE